MTRQRLTPWSRWAGGPVAAESLPMRAAGFSLLGHLLMGLLLLDGTGKGARLVRPLPETTFVIATFQILPQVQPPTPDEPSPALAEAVPDEPAPTVAPPPVSRPELPPPEPAPPAITKPEPPPAPARSPPAAVAKKARVSPNQPQRSAASPQSVVAEGVPSRLPDRSLEREVAYLHHPQPVYPPFARRMGQEGTVLLKVAVDQEGSVTQVVIHQSSGHPLLDQAALAAVRHYRFLPAARQGRPVASNVEVPIRFRLTES